MLFYCIDQEYVIQVYSLKIRLFHLFQIQWWNVSAKLSIALGLNLQDGAPRNKYHVEEMSNSLNETVSTLSVRSIDVPDEGMYRCVLIIPGKFYPAWPKSSGFWKIIGTIINRRNS